MGAAEKMLRVVREAKDEGRLASLRRELELARARVFTHGSILRLTLADMNCDLDVLAQRADEASVEAGRLAGFARLLAREEK